MDLNSPASLVFYSSVKIAASLFYHQDLLYLERKKQYLVGWVQVQDRVTQLVQSLELPKNIEENIQELIQPVGDQIRQWLSKRACVIRCNADLYNKFSWTSHGMIDYKRTAFNLIQSGQLDLHTNITLACLDAVVEYLFGLTKTPGATKLFKPTKSYPVCGRDTKVGQECVLMMRPLLIEMTGGRLDDSHYEFAVNQTARNGNTSLTRHFLSKIDSHKRFSIVREQVVRIFRSNNRFVNLDTLLFLLSQMDARQIDELFIENTEHVLLRFLEWPLQRHFMKLASKLWGAMTTATFISILQAIVVHIIQHCFIATNPFGYRDIFRDFWLSSPAEYRRVAMIELIIPILSSLFRSHGYFNSVLHLFRDESYLQKLEILFFSNAYAVLEILSNENKAKAFEFVIQRYFSSNDIPCDFIEKYSSLTEKYLESYYGENDMAD